jgi:amino acid transporter
VALSFGSYASSVFGTQDATWVKAFACAVVLAMTVLNVAGSTAVARVQSAIVKVVISILVVFAVVTIVNIEPALLAPSGYPTVREIVSSMALTFFAFLGFGVITFTAKDLPDPSRQLPRAMYMAVAIATVVYVGVAVGVFGTLTVDEVIASGGTALAEAAKPTLGNFGYVLMVVTALFSTTGAVNSGLYPTVGLSQHLASTGQFPSVLGRGVGRRGAPVGLLASAALALLFVVAFDLNAIASLGSAIALLVFSLITIGHFRLTKETRARRDVLALALLSTLLTLVVFATTTLVEEPATVVALVLIVALSIVIDLLWTRARDRSGASAAPT